ncbi:MAG: Na/Pi cotransporter family protein [Verrucomicrobiales bacterium]
MDVLIKIIHILGCLGVFLFGMKVLSEGIQKSAGEKMRYFMATCTRNRFAGLFTGLFTTSLLQSSSATTVIVVSFVNAGLLTLVESIGIIMGANLGTTVTAWLIAWVGKVSVSSFAIPIVGIGLPLIFMKKPKAKAIGEVFIGFGLLFFGLGLLKDAVPTKDDVEGSTAFIDFLTNMSGRKYLSVLLFLGAGILLTLVVQSSSAAMAITVTLATKGYIGFEESAAIVLGENIGTTVTAWLASLGASANAKRAARAHFLFNVLGVCWMLIVFYAFTAGVQWLAGHLPESMRAPGSAHKSDIGFSLALFHTSFNFINICLLVGFVPLIAKIVTRWVKDDDETGAKHRLTYISGGMVEVGELNLPEAEKATRELGTLTKEMHDAATSALLDPNVDATVVSAKLKELEANSDAMMHDITEYLVRCSTTELSDVNAHELTGMMRIVAELEEIADCEFRIGKLLERAQVKERTFCDEAMAGLKEISDAVGAFIAFYNERLLKPIRGADIKEATKMEEAIDEMRHRLNKQALQRMKGDSEIPTEMLYVDINNQLEKIGNHALNIIETGHDMAPTA